MKYAHLSDAARVDILSPRERQVLDLTLAGLPTKEIAFRLDMSPKTVGTYRAGASKKLGVSSTVDLVKFAIRVGLIVAE